MNSVATGSSINTLADLVERLGGIPLDRIRIHPPPGTATEQDVIRIEQQEHLLCELVEGVLVEKAVGFRESLLAAAIVGHLREFVKPRNLGLVLGADGMVRLFAGLVRIPDVAFISWGRLPGGKVPDEPIPQVTPDLIIEVLSRGNTPGEMRRKLEEYFHSGAAMVWLADPERRCISVFSSADDSRDYHEGQSLDGGSVLPGFSLAVSNLFAELDRRADG